MNAESKGVPKELSLGGEGGKALSLKMPTKTVEILENFLQKVLKMLIISDFKGLLKASKEVNMPFYFH